VSGSSPPARLSPLVLLRTGPGCSLSTRRWSPLPSSPSGRCGTALNCCWPVRSKSRTLLLLPMGVGRIRIPNAGRWHKPTVYVGALERGRWARYEVFQPRVTDGVAEIEIDQDRNLSMLWIAEAGAEKSVAELAETWVLRPWALQ